MTLANRFDHIAIKAIVTSDGWIRDRPVITRSGIFEYRRPDGKIVKEWRSPEEVFKADSLNTLLGVPITDGHNGIVKDNDNSILGTVLSSGVQDGNNVVADIVIHKSQRIGKRRELSLGYRAEVVSESGTTPDGERYDATQRNIQYNHLALVEQGRAGNARLRLDSNDAVSFSMEDEVPEQKMVTVRIDELEYAAAQEVARALVKLQEEAELRNRGYDTLQAEKDSLAGQVQEAAMILEAVAESIDDDKNAPRKELGARVKTALVAAKESVKHRMELEAVAAKQSVKFDDKTTDRQLRELVVKSIRGDETMKFDDKSDDYVNSAFDISLQLVEDKKQKITSQRQATKPPAPGVADKKVNGANFYRDAYLKRIQERATQV